MANHVGKRYRAVVELGGIEVAEDEEFTVTQKHLDGADFDFLLTIGAIEPIGRPKPEAAAPAGGETKDKAAAPAAGGSDGR